MDLVVEDDEPKSSLGCVYKIVNNITGDTYIGSTKQKPENRWATHKSLYQWEAHPNRPLYMAMKKYGVENFSFRVLEISDNYLECEQKWIDKLRPTYNQRKAFVQNELCDAVVIKDIKLVQNERTLSCPDWGDEWLKDFEKRTTNEKNFTILEMFRKAPKNVRYRENFLYDLKHQVERKLGCYVSMDECAQALKDDDYKVIKIENADYSCGYTYKVSLN